MELKELQREVQKDKDRSVPLCIKTSKEKSAYMKAKNVSPTKLFNLSLDELMAKNPLAE